MLRRGHCAWVLLLCVTVLKFLIILAFSLCFVSEVHWDHAGGLKLRLKLGLASRSFQPPQDWFSDASNWSLEPLPPYVLPFPRRDLGTGESRARHTYLSCQA